MFDVSLLFNWVVILLSLLLVDIAFIISYYFIMLYFHASQVFDKMLGLVLA